MPRNKNPWRTRKPNSAHYQLYDFARSKEQAEQMLEDLAEGQPVAHKSTSEGGEYNIYVRKGSVYWRKEGGSAGSSVRAEGRFNDDTGSRYIKHHDTLEEAMEEVSTYSDEELDKESIRYYDYKGKLLFKNGGSAGGNDPASKIEKSELDLGHMYSSYINDANSVSIYEEHNVYFIIGFRDNKLFSYAFDKFSEAKSAYREMLKMLKTEALFREHEDTMTESDREAKRKEIENFDWENWGDSKELNNGGSAGEETYAQWKKRNGIKIEKQGNMYAAVDYQGYAIAKAEHKEDLARTLKNLYMFAKDEDAAMYEGGGEIEASDLSNWDKKLHEGEDVVVYDKNGVKYIYQGSSGEKDSVAVMKGFDESTYRMMPLSEIKSIEIGSIYAGGGEVDHRTPYMKKYPNSRYFHGELTFLNW